MLLVRRFIALFAALFLALPAMAWNYSGHWIIAEIAYQRLTPQARARADEMIRDHPDYKGIFIKDAPRGKADCRRAARYAFVHAAASWPDLIRGDIRVLRSGQPDSLSPTPLLPGFPDMMRHRDLALFRHSDFGRRHARDRSSSLRIL